MGHLADLIKKFSPQLAIAGKTPSYSDVSKLLKEFFSAAKNLSGIEDEIILYIKENLYSKEWKNYTLWIPAGIDHPSTRYIEYLLRILETDDPSFPHWHALDCLKYMLESISEGAVPGLINIIESNNPSWSKDVSEQALDTLVFIGSDEGISFIERVVDMPNKAVAERATYWLERFADRDKE